MDENVSSAFIHMKNKSEYGDYTISNTDSS